MSEKLERVVMHAFRGVPGEMTVDFGKGESIAVYGDNGTGKSTIADALEWYFTGEIELLSHEGRQHAVRYVGGDDDGVTSVEVLTNGTLGGKAVFPDERNPEAFQAIRRETFLLRGRTLADFINKTKTEKWKALVEILGLDAIEGLREDLQRARNELRKELKVAEEQVQSHRRALASAGAAVTHETVLANLQEICGMLSVEPPRSLDQVVDPSWLTATIGAVSSEPSERESVLTGVRTLNPPALDTSTLEGWNALVSSERARLLPGASLVREAKRLVETRSIDGRCPLCGQSVDEKQLAARIERALVDLMEASRELDRFREPIAQGAEDLAAAHEKRLALQNRARALALELPPVPSAPPAKLQSSVDALAPVDIKAITGYLSELRKWDRAAGKVAQTASLSGASTRDTQLLMLAAVCEQVRSWRLAEQKAARALRARTLADRVFDAYQTKQKDDLAELLKHISHRVAQIYSSLHPDEDLAGVSIEPWTAKGVELAIEFYGSHQRPPHGVLSESHLNSLAIALFLAMAEEFNEQLGFLLLDDVINSFDVEHRGRLAELLADGFSDWQLIVLTHDQQFFEHLSRRAPSWRKLELTSWSYASGPRTTRYETSGILAAARDRLANGDVHGAAAKARRGLEELLQEVCEALWAPLPFRRGQANDKREIGELFKGLRRTLRERAKTLLVSVEPLLKNLEADVGATLNVEIHGSRRRSAASEVEAALKRIEALDQQWSCPQCRTRVWHRGMGVVYVAEDTKLDRRVALKLLRLDVAESPDRRARFDREAKAAAALNHPNIVHIYSVEESDGLLFITMELVQGRSLRELLSAGAPLPLPRTLAFAAQMAEGLACAHAAGILHRDLKPGNVMITEDDRVKILDFGLAKLFTQASPWDPEAETVAHAGSSTGMTLGTAGYMSPEQALGKTLDARTDVFALGVVLFEMATGRAPFEGDTLAAVFDQLLNRRPPSPRTLNPALPAFLSAVIDKALEKHPERRYLSANELLLDLRRVDPSSARGATPVRASAEARMPSSIVVLPFVDLSPRRDQEYFCHGITEEIINTLTRVPGLRVTSRTSAFAFQGKDLEVTEIGRRLRVGAALEGSVRKAGDRVRITAQLVDAEDGYQLWSKRFDRELADVFAIQDEIAAIIVNELRSGLAGVPAFAEATAGKPAASAEATAGKPARRRAPFDLEAHDAYLKGMYALNKWTDGSMRGAIADFRQAIARDPDFAPAYAALAEGHIWLYSGVGILPAEDTVPQARWAVEKALELDPTLADAHKVRALIAMNHDWDRKGAADALTRALELGPGSAAVHLWNAWRLSLLERRHDQALVELEEAERLDPLDLQLKTQIGYVHHFHHNLDRAIEQFEKVLALEPSFAFAHYALGDACTQKGQYDRAFAEFDKAIELGGRSVNHIGVLGYAYGRSGNRSQAKALLQELTARAAHGYVSAMWIALVHLGLSDLESLFHWLDRAFEERDGSLVLITATVEFDPVREDPRFKSLLGRMGLGHLASRPA